MMSTDPTINTGPEQVGMHAMVASAEEGCKVFSAATTLDPHALFEKVGFAVRGPFLSLIDKVCCFLDFSPPCCCPCVE